MEPLPCGLVLLPAPGFLSDGKARSRRAFGRAASGIGTRLPRAHFRLRSLSGYAGGLSNFPSS